MLLRTVHSYRAASRITYQLLLSNMSDHKNVPEPPGRVCETHHQPDSIQAALWSLGTHLALYHDTNGRQQ